MVMLASEIVSILEAERSEALGADASSDLRAERENALAYYEGDMTKDLPNPIDRSKAVSTDVSDVVEGLMPQLMDIFCSGDESVVFNPQGAEDVEAAEQETDYINYVVDQQNPGFLIKYSMVKDALLSKVGVVKAWWEERDEESKETYRGLTDDQYALLAADDAIEIVEHTEYPLGSDPREDDPEEKDEGASDQEDSEV